jgi:hypothetical protein
MSYVIRNIRPSVIYLPDAGLRLDSGQTTVVETLSPQMQELLANQALEAISSDPDPPAPVEEAPTAADTSTESPAPVPVEDVPVAPPVEESAAPVVTEKKTRKSGMATIPSEPSDDTR